MANNQEAKDEIQYLESVLSQLEIAGPMDIEAIKEELTAEGYLKKEDTEKQKKKKPSQPDQYFSSDGTLILVGKNNLQNDQLTMKTAKKTDYWLHAKISLVRTSSSKVINLQMKQLPKLPS